MREMGLSARRAPAPGAPQLRTFPSRVPVFSLDRIYTRGFALPRDARAARPGWARMSDHLPLVAELELA